MIADHANVFILFFDNACYFSLENPSNLDIKSFT